VYGAIDYYLENEQVIGEYIAEGEKHAHALGQTPHRHGWLPGRRCGDRRAMSTVRSPFYERRLRPAWNHIDPSDSYGPHVIKLIIKRALHPYPDGLAIVTKVGARRGEDKSGVMLFRIGS
jgi:hypothetical protein